MAPKQQRVQQAESWLTPQKVRGASFFQLVRLLADTSWKRGEHDPGLDLPGIRFKPDLSLGFPAADVTSVEAREESGALVHVVTCTFMGLYGSSSPLPIAYLMELFAEENEVVRDFLDIVNHRLILLFFRTWQRFRYLFQRADDATDDLTTLLLALAGYHRVDLEVQTGFSPGFLMYWAGLLARRPSSRTTLETILRASVHPEVRIEECVLRRVAIPDAQLFRLDSRKARLGATVTIGRAVLDRTGKFRIRIGPVDLAEVEKFFPGGPGLERLDRIVRLVLRDWLDYEVALVVDPDDILGLQLGGGAGARLHLTSWLGTPRARRVIVTIQGEPGGRRQVRVAQSKEGD